MIELSFVLGNWSQPHLHRALHLNRMATSWILARGHIVSIRSKYYFYLIGVQGPLWFVWNISTKLTMHICDVETMTRISN